MLEMLSRVDTPALILDMFVVRKNIAKMADFFRPLPAGMRASYSAHKSTKLAKMQMEAGAVGVSCSRLGEAEVVVSTGVMDILVSNPVVGGLKIERLMRLLERGVDIKVVVDDEQNVRELCRAATAQGRELGLLVEVDVGGGLGIKPGDRLIELARFVDESPNLIFRGLLAYVAGAQRIPEREKRKSAAGAAMEDVMRGKTLVEESGLEVETVCVGGTATYEFVAQFPGVTEVLVGPYVTLDAQHAALVPEFEVAATVLSTVTSCPREAVAIADAGLTTLSSDGGLPQVMAPEGVTLKLLEDEFAVLDVAPGVQLKPGGRVRFIPSHCATTANLHNEYVCMEHERELDRWMVDGRGKTR
jgi:D-serine deaminase-like pyridoxal phosphate-dependent protein